MEFRIFEWNNVEVKMFSTETRISDSIKIHQIQFNFDDEQVKEINVVEAVNKGLTERSVFALPLFKFFNSRKT